MIDKITSVFDNYSGKIKNPFIGTIISVWLIHNWRIPFALFNFDKDCTMIEKINFIADYFGKQNFWEEWINIVGISFLILLFTFLLMWISRFITDFFYKVAEPFIVTIIDKNAIYTKEEKERLEARILNLNSKIFDRENEIVNLEGAYNKVNSEKEKELSYLNEQIGKLNANNEGLKALYVPFSNVRSEFEKYFSRLSQQTLRNFFTIIDDNENIYIQTKNDVDLLLANGIIYDKKPNVKIMDISMTNTINQPYQLTKYGKIFVKYIKQSEEFI